MTKDKAFDEIFHLFRRLSKGIAVRITKNETAAEDICQEVFLEFYNKMDTLDYEDLEHVRAWIVICTKYRGLDYCRRKQREQRILEKELECKKTQNPSGLTDSAECVALERERNRIRAEILQEFMEEYPEDYEMFRKINVRGEESQSVADEYRITKNTLYTRLYRMKARLRKEFGKRYRDP